jgi:hypothetical protein
VVAVLWGSERGWRIPVPRQQCMQFVVLGSPRDDPLQDIGEIGQWLDAVELAALDQGIGDRPTAGSSVRAGAIVLGF